MSYPQEKMKDVYTIMKGIEGRKDRWVRIGIGFLNGDNSISVRLDAAPTNGTLHIREYRRDFQRQRIDGETPVATTEAPTMMMSEGGF
jgi:hypothetical protein